MKVKNGKAVKAVKNSKAVKKVKKGKAVKKVKKAKAVKKVKKGHKESVPEFFLVEQDAREAGTSDMGSIRPGEMKSLVWASLDQHTGKTHKKNAATTSSSSGVVALAT